MFVDRTLQNEPAASLPKKNEPPAQLSEDAFSMLQALLKGGVAVYRPKHETRFAQEAGVDGLKWKRSIRPVERISVGRTLYGVDGYHELQAHGIIDERGDLTEKGRLLRKPENIILLAVLQPEAVPEAEPVSA